MPAGSETLQVHASCVLFEGAGLLLRGVPGSGKSDLALRLIDQGAVLVADDRVDLAIDATGGLVASAPEILAGQIEVRGFGIFALPFEGSARLNLVVDLVTPDAVERLPEPQTCVFLGIAVPLVAIAPFQASAVAKLRLAACIINSDIEAGAGN